MDTKLQFTKATKEQAKLRLALFGPSGAGKTYSALRIATGMGGKIALIDTEHGSASKYADRFEFDVLEIGTKTIPVYVEAIQAAEAAGYEILIIDSLSHGWKELLAEVDKLAKTKYRNNSFAAWSEGTPKQAKLVDAILEFDGHVISTIRSKTDWLITTDDKGKSKPERIGLAPEQGKGIEYEFDLLMEISPDHTAHVLKDRTGKYQDDYIEKPDERLGRDLIAWLSEGVPAKDRKTKVDYRELVNSIGIDNDEARQIYDSFGGDFTKAYAHLEEQYADIIKKEDAAAVDVTEEQPEGAADEEQAAADSEAGGAASDSEQAAEAAEKA